MLPYPLEITHSVIILWLTWPNERSSADSLFGNAQLYPEVVQASSLFRQALNEPLQNNERVCVCCDVCHRRYWTVIISGGAFGRLLSLVKTVGNNDCFFRVIS